MQQYAFVLGRVYTLSLAELLCLLANMGVSYRIVACSPEVVIVETDKQIDAQAVQARLGGVIKIIRLFDSFQKKGKEYPSQTLENYFTFKRVKNDYFSDYSGKRQFGVSIYTLDPALRFREESQRIAFYIKKILQEEAQSVRAVVPQFPAQALSSVLVNENQLLHKGAEICVIAGNQRVFVGKTVVVQNYEDYGRRDYQRPARDERAGMIPPKVAQVMINLAGTLKPLDYILDPFCGSGTILQEAMLMGYRAIGSDIEQVAIENSEKNLEWFRNRYRVSPGRYKLFASHAAEISLHLPNFPVSAVVSEGTLGPIYVKPPKKAEMTANFKNLAKLYDQVFKEFKKFLKPGSRIVMSFPAYRQANYEYEFFPALDFIGQNGYTVVDPISPEITAKYKFLRVTDRKSIVYDRKDQIVAREIMIIENNPSNGSQGIGTEEVKLKAVIADAEASKTEFSEESDVKDGA
ncbi:MAG: TRM11 family SAM-dependent methyltransferase [Candidatus Saccharibacteria bacterium]